MTRSAILIVVGYADWEKFCNINDVLKRVIGTLVNWHISVGILTKTACYYWNSNPGKLTYFSRYFDEDSLLFSLKYLLKCVNLPGFQWLASMCRFCCRIFLSAKWSVDKLRFYSWKLVVFETSLASLNEFICQKFKQI